MTSSTWFLRSALLFIPSLLPLPAQAQSGTPAIAFEEIRHDLGEVWEGETLRHVFRFRNTGDAILLAKGG